jgi:site-specific recombinase XerD
MAHLFRDRKLLAATIGCRVAALRFFFVKTLRRPYLPDHIPFPKRPRQLPTVLSPEEVERLIDSAENLMRRTMVMTLYSTGVRCAELCHLKVSDIDSDRMVIHVRKAREAATATFCADLRTIQVLLGHAKLGDTAIYLHLSRRHLQAVASPLGAIEVSSPDTVKRSRRLIKR